MQGSDYIFAFQSKAFAFWQPDGSGGVSINNIPYFLDFAPDGWDGIAIQNIRNKRLWGIDRTVTIPLAYVQDAAHILKHIFYTLGIEENVYLVIAKQEIEYTAGVEYGYWYKQIYRGEVDLSTFIHNGSKVTCTTLEDGLPKYLKSNEGTVYEFPMNVPEALMVKMDGIVLHEKLNYQDINGLEVSKADLGDHFFGPISYVGSEGNNVGLAIDSETLETSPSAFADRLLSTNTLLTNVGNDTVNVTISGVIEFICTGMTSSPAYAIKFRYLRSKMLIGNQNDYQVISTAAMVVGQTYTQAFSITVPLTNGESLLREGIFFGGAGSDAKIEFTSNSKASMTFTTRQATTYIRAFRPQYLFTQLINKVTESEYAAETSSYLSLHSNKVFTCGNAIRGLNDAVMKISFSDFFQFWDCFDSVGISEKAGLVNIDSKPNLVDTSDIIDLAEPSNLKISVAKEYLFNELEIGYPEIRNEVGVINGNQEFNCKFLFSTGTVKSPAKLDKISKIKASCYEIELIRVTTLSKDTTDNKADNDLFVLQILENLQPASGIIPAHYQLDRLYNSTATGLIEPLTVFNLGLTPKKNLLRNGQFLRSSLYLSDNKILSYKSSDKNNAVVSEGITESANVPVSSLGDKFFYPVIADMDVPAPEDLLSLLDTNPLKVFRFPFYGDYYYGLLVKVSIAPSNRKEQNYQLLLLPSSDLTKLISYYG